MDCLNLSQYAGFAEKYFEGYLGGLQGREGIRCSPPSP